MRLKNCTLTFVKNLYLEKLKALEENNQEKIEHLKVTFPELFNAQFLMDLLKNEVQREKYGLDNDMIMKNYLFQYQ